MKIAYSSVAMATGYGLESLGEIRSELQYASVTWNSAAP
jgi:hypothetical protein